MYGIDSPYVIILSGSMQRHLHKKLVQRFFAENHIKTISTLPVWNQLFRGVLSDN